METKNRMVRVRAAWAFFCARVPLGARVIFGVALFSALLHLLSCCFPAVADFLNATLCAAVRFLLAKISDILPFSIAETCLFALPFLLPLLLVLFVRAAHEKARFLRALCVCLSALCVLYSLFVLTIGCAYRGTKLDSRMGLTADGGTVAQLSRTAVWLRGEVNARAPLVMTRAGGGTVMPYTYEEMNEKLLAAYAAVGEKYPGLLSSLRSRVKPVTASEGMSYLHLTGVYTYMTGEANINCVFPDYTIPFTAAHELAHQRGIARENEANFIAFLVCTSSDDVYLQYSGYLNMLEYVAASVYRVNPQRYARLAGEYHKTVVGEMAAYRAFYKKYADSAIGEVSRRVNNAYLQIQGTEGVRSYGMVTDLAIAYYLAEYEA